MRLHALAADYDGTLAQDGVVDETTMRALERFAESGRKLVLVTGRELDQLKTVFPSYAIFDRIVAENGALLYTPKTGAERLLAVPPPARFADELRKRGVSPLSVGRCIVATLHPHESTVLDVIRELGLELHVIFNKGSVMILPVTVSKATGLASALEELALSRHNVVAVGDAENDHALLQCAEYGVAVANALPTLKQSADRTTRFPRGAGVTELIDDVVTNDLAQELERLTRHRLSLGKATTGGDVTIIPSGLRLLVSAPKADCTRVVRSLCDAAITADYQICIIDASADPVSLRGAIVLGSSDRAPSLAELTSALELPKASVLVRVAAVAPAGRAAFVEDVLALARSAAQHAGRPHFVVVEQADQLIDLGGTNTPVAARAFITKELPNVVLTTSAPDSISPTVARHATAFVALGADAGKSVATLSRAGGFDVAEHADVGSGRAYFWTSTEAPIAFTPTRSV